jgi:hypothetical protein
MDDFSQCQYTLLVLWMSRRLFDIQVDRDVAVIFVDTDKVVNSRQRRRASQFYELVLESAPQGHWHR